MINFVIHFFVCNLWICGIIAMLLLLRRTFKGILSCRMRYHLGFLLLGLLIVPLIPFHFIPAAQILPQFPSLKKEMISLAGNSAGKIAESGLTTTTDWMNDFALSANKQTPPAAAYLITGIWLAGVLVMLALIIRSSLRLRVLRKSALPIQNAKIDILYHRCLEEAGIHKAIPVYHTAFLRSPVMAGLLRPCIFLPDHLTREYREPELRYMLLHELQHYKHKDILAGYLMNLTEIVYWFNPVVRYMLKEMRIDREIACDSSVLKLLKTEDYEAYGNTLINYAEKLSLCSFSFATGLGGSMKQMKRRILNIASYEKPTFRKKLSGMTAFALIAVLLLGCTPFLSTYAADETHYHWNSSQENVSCTDLSSYFGAYDGCFVLYNAKADAWKIYNPERAVLRLSPDSTYKIYDALFALEEGIITPEDSFIAWNGETYPFAAWNEDQTLRSAMENSVNWYFTSLDEQLGKTAVSDYIQGIGYGNENISGGFPTYWMESSLKISPIEQVELLTGLYENSFDFDSENIDAVKDAIHLSSHDGATLYGKTGTGRIDGQDVNGWFVGFIETGDHTYFFAANIGADKDATGSRAAEITMEILKDINIIP